MEGRGNRRYAGSILFLIIFLLTACSDTRLRDDGVRERLFASSSGYSFRLDTLVTEPWDMLLVVKPYRFREIEKHHIHMSKKLRKKLEKISLHNEDMCVLLFVKDNTLVKYVPVNSAEHRSMNFAEVDTLDEGLFPETVFRLDSLGRIMVMAR